jgi:hypothetical protein
MRKSRQALDVGSEQEQKVLRQQHVDLLEQAEPCLFGPRQA